MKWRYRNDTDRAVFWNGVTWGPGTEREISCPVPSSLGLTLVQEGDGPDPVLCHEDLIVQSGETASVELDGPTLAHKVRLSLYCMGGTGVEARFNSADNRPFPVDARGFYQVMPWEMCARMYFTNPTNEETHVSVSAVEVTA